MLKQIGYYGFLVSVLFNVWASLTLTNGDCLFLSRGSLAAISIYFAIMIVPMIKERAPLEFSGLDIFYPVALFAVSIFAAVINILEINA